jgi:hypothetical protein
LAISSELKRADPPCLEISVRETKKIKYPREYGILQAEQFGEKAWN